MKMGFFGGLQKGISGMLFLRDREREREVREVGLVGGHLKTSISSFPFFLSLFLFCFSSTHINFGPAGPLMRESERVWWCGLLFGFFDGEGVRGTSMFLLGCVL